MNGNARPGGTETGEVGWSATSHDTDAIGSTPHAWLGYLAGDLGSTRGSLLVLSRANDPWNTGTPSDLRDAEWLAAAWADHVTTTSHLRRLHYRLMTEERITPKGSAYLNDDRHWKWVQLVARKARDLGVIDPAEVEDRRNREIAWNHEAGDVPTPGATEPRLYVPDPAYLDASVLVRAPEVDGYQPTAVDEPYRVAVVAEKSTVDDVLSPLCARLGVDYISGTGYLSHTRIRQLVLADPRPLRVVYISDHDKAGLTMPVQFARRMELLAWQDPDGVGAVDVALDPLVLTVEQIDHYGLPRSPDKGATELDALKSLHPGELARIVRGAVAEWRDPDHQGRLWEARAEAVRLVNEAWEPYWERVRLERQRVDELLAEAADAYAERVREITAGEAMAELRRLVDQAADDLRAVELPERPEPQVADPADGWLYRSDRDYLVQLDAYRGAR